MTNYYSSGSDSASEIHQQNKTSGFRHRPNSTAEKYTDEKLGIPPVIRDATYQKKEPPSASYSQRQNRFGAPSLTSLESLGSLLPTSAWPWKNDSIKQETTASKTRNASSGKRKSQQSTNSHTTKRISSKNARTSSFPSAAGENNSSVQKNRPKSYQQLTQQMKNPDQILPHVLLTKNLKDLSKEYVRLKRHQSSNTVPLSSSNSSFTEQQNPTQQRSQGDFSHFIPPMARHKMFSALGLKRLGINASPAPVPAPPDAVEHPSRPSKYAALFKLVQKFIKVLIHVVPSYYLLLTKSPLHLLMYNIVLYNAMGVGGGSSEQDATNAGKGLSRLGQCWNLPWLRVVLCALALTARLGILYRLNAAHSEWRKNKLREELALESEMQSVDQNETSSANSKNVTQPSLPLHKSILRMVVSLPWYSMYKLIFHTLPILISFWDLRSLLAIKSQTHQSNGLFLSVYSNPNIFALWREDRIRTLRKMRHVSKRAALRAITDAVLILLLLQSRIMGYLRRKNFLCFFQPKENTLPFSETEPETPSAAVTKEESSIVTTQETLILETNQEQTQDSDHPVRQSKSLRRRTFSVKRTILVMWKYVRYLKFLKYYSKPLHIIIFKLLYYHMDWDIFLHVVSLLSHVLLYLKCKRMDARHVQLQ